MAGKLGTATSGSRARKQAVWSSSTAPGGGTELAFLKHGFHHALNMRLATEIQDETTQKYRVAQPTTHQSHEIPADLARRPAQISQHLALAAQATHDAVRVWTVATGALS